MSKLVKIIISEEKNYRNTSLDSICSSATLEQLLEECDALDDFWRKSNNLYEKVRALFFLYAIHRFHIPLCNNITAGGQIPFDGYNNHLKRRFEEAIECFIKFQKQNGPSQGISSSLSTSYHSLGFQILADQVRKSVKSIRGNQWMFRIGHPSDHPLRINPRLRINLMRTTCFRFFKKRPRLGWILPIVVGVIFSFLEWTFPKEQEY